MLSWVCFEGQFTLGTLLVACLGGFVIQVCVPHAIHMPFSFQRKEIEMNEKGGSPKKKDAKKNRKVVNKVFGMSVTMGLLNFSLKVFVGFVAQIFNCGVKLLFRH